MFARALIFLLVMLNLGVALWWVTRVDATGPEGGEELPAGIARLQLASEAAPMVAAEPPAAAQDIEVRDEPATPRSEQCFTLGPFADDAAATAARAALPPSVLRVRPREAVPANAAWRVVMPALADRGAATEMATRLRQAGFDDLFVVAEGAEANSIALGRFGGEAAATRHVEALRQAGFEVRAEAIGGARRHWLDVAIAGDASVAGLRGTPGATRVDAIDCTRLR